MLTAHSLNQMSDHFQRNVFLIRKFSHPLQTQQVNSFNFCSQYQKFLKLSIGNGSGIAFSYEVIKAHLFLPWNCELNFFNPFNVFLW